jgi:hypothetical protein
VTEYIGLWVHLFIFEARSTRLFTVVVIVHWVDKGVTNRNNESLEVVYSLADIQTLNCHSYLRDAFPGVFSRGWDGICVVLDQGRIYQVLEAGFPRRLLATMICLPLSISLSLSSASFANQSLAILFGSWIMLDS